jgi:transaldolase
VRALKGGAPSVVSVFAGRIADTGRDPVPLMSEAAKMCRDTDPNIELLWASSREFFNLVQAELCGCHIITCTTDIIKKLSMLNKDLQALSLETIQTFKTDSDAAGFQL